jgi:hypothetical protein
MVALADLYRRGDFAWKQQIEVYLLCRVAVAGINRSRYLSDF